MVQRRKAGSASARKAAPRPRAPAYVPRMPAPAPMVRSYAVSRARPARKQASGPMASLGSALGGAAGTYLGGPAGTLLGSALGGLGGRFLGRIFGTGDYVTSDRKPKFNVLVNDGQVPQFGSTSNVVHIRHREFLGDVISSSNANTFKIDSYSINPGLATTFPWLSQVCGSTYQQYRINGMVFEYRTMSSDALNSTNTALGQVVMATDYDSADAAFTSKQQMENTEYGISCKPSCSMMHAIECARTQTSVSEQYIRAYAVPSGADVRLYDLGKFYIATNGFQGTSVNCGELWVSYDITLFKAIEQPPGYLQPVAVYNLVGVNSTHPMGTSQTAIVDQIGLTFTANKIQLPANIQQNSYWFFYWQIIGDSTASVPNPGVTRGNGIADLSANDCSVFMPETTSTCTTTSISEINKYTSGGSPAALPYFNIANQVVPANNTFARVCVIGMAGPAIDTAV